MTDHLKTIREAIQHLPAHYKPRMQALTALDALEQAMREPVAFVHWPIHGAPRLVWYGNKPLGAAIIKSYEGHQPDMLLFAAPPAQQAQYPLPDRLYPDSKDWTAGSYAERVEWLHFMYEGQKALVAEYQHQLEAQQAQAEAVRWERKNDAGEWVDVPRGDEQFWRQAGSEIRNKAEPKQAEAVPQDVPQDAKRLDWLLGDGRSMAIDSFGGQHRVVDASCNLVVTDWMPSKRDAIDAAMAAAPQTKGGE